MTYPPSTVALVNSAANGYNEQAQPQKRGVDEVDGRIVGRSVSILPKSTKEKDPNEVSRPLLLDPYLVENILFRIDSLEKKKAFRDSYVQAQRRYLDQIKQPFSVDDFQKIPDASVIHATQIHERINARFGIPSQLISTPEGAIPFLSETQRKFEIINNALPENLHSPLSSKDLVGDIGLLEDIFQKAYDYSLVQAFEELSWPDKTSPLNVRANRIINCLKKSNFEKITSLDLSNKNLVSVPKEINNFALLKELILSNNRLSWLPPEIGKLHELKYLYLQNNQLTTLPPEIATLHKLEIFRRENNPFTTLPPEIANHIVS